MAIGTPTSIGSAVLNGAGTSLAMTLTASVSVGDFIVASTGIFSTAVSPTMTFTDSGGNTYVTSVNAINKTAIGIARCTTALTSGVSTITASYGGTANALTIAAAKVTGLLTSGAITDVTATGTSNGTGTAWSAGTTATTTQADELVWGACSCDTAAAATNTPGAGYTEVHDITNGGAFQLTTQYKIVSATGTQNPTGTWTSTSQTWNACAATFKAAAGGTDATVTAVTATALGSAPPAVVTANSAITAVIADATGAAAVAVVSAGANATVTAATAVAAGSAPVAAATVTANSTVTAVVADATAAAPAATVSGAGSATVTAVPATALGSAPPANSILSSVVSAPAVIALGSGPAATIASAGNATVTAVTALASGSAPAGVLSGAQTWVAVIADGTGAGVAATISAGATVTAVPALANGQAPRPAITPAPVGGGSGFVAATFSETGGSGSGGEEEVEFTVSGDPEVDAVLTTSGVPGDASLQWYRDATPISGATSPTYTVRAVDQGHDITCRATDPSNAITLPPGLGTGLAFAGAGRVAWNADAINLSNTAHSMWALWEPVGANGVSWTLLGGESSVGKAHWVWFRMGGGSFWVPDSLGFYRYRLPPDDNEDLVWTTDVAAGTNPGITATLSDGLLSSFVGKPLLGGAGNELYASQYKLSGGAWVHDTNSPSRFNFQIALGSPLGTDGKIIMGVANGNDFLRANVHAVAIFEDLITDWDAVMAAKSTHAILQQGPVWCTDSSVNLEVDLTANGGDMIESSGVDQADPLDEDVWLMGP